MGKLIDLLTGGWIGPLVGSVALAAALWGGYAYITHTARSEGRAEVQKLWDADTQARELLAAAAAENVRVKESQHAIDIETERTHREHDGIVVGTVLADTRNQLERLRITTATRTAGAVQASSSAAAGRGIDGSAAVIGTVFDECAGQLVDMGQQAEDLGIRLRGLQAWAGSAVGVCGE